MTIFVATTTLSRYSATHDHANLICYQVNKRAITHEFMEDEHRVREALDKVAAPQVQRSLEISIEPVDM
jgi:hypothetical protein